MIQTVYRNDFHDAFKGSRPDNFSYEGLNALYDYFDEYEEGTGEAVELDVIAICVEYTEYENLKEFQGNYDAEEYPDLDTIRDSTNVIEIDGSDGFIIQDF